MDLLSHITFLLREYPVSASLATLLVLVLVQRQVKTGRPSLRNLPLPPSPKGYPLIGSLFDVPKEKPWVAYTEWAKTYGTIFCSAQPMNLTTAPPGDMIYFEVLGQRFLILNSLEKVQDLLEKRSSNYSDRARMPMVLELWVIPNDYAKCQHNTSTEMLRFAVWIAGTIWPYYRTGLGGVDTVASSMSISMQMLSRSTSLFRDERPGSSLNACLLLRRISCITFDSESPIID